MGLTLVDSSVWIDLLTDRSTRQVDMARRLLDEDSPIAIGDLILAEVLQGSRHEHQFERALGCLSAFTPVTIVDEAVAIAAARNYRALRTLGIIVRKTIDTLIATRCILDSMPLLYSDRDFDPFVQHLGLRSALDMPGVR